MEGEESLLDSIYEDDVEMVDVEEGELVGDGLPNENGLSGDGGAEIVCEGSGGGNGKKSGLGNSVLKKKNKKRSKKKKRNVSVPKVTDVNRFVLEACRRLKEKKSYMVYNAVGCLGVVALGEILKEVDAIQACGGQMTADGRRQRTGGGILWNILKTREPKAYKEIMRKSRDFEKQFRPQGFKQASKGIGTASQVVTEPQANHSSGTESDDTPALPEASGHSEHTALEGMPEQSKIEGVVKQKSVHERMRVPVRYDDLFEEDPKCHSS